MKYWLTTHWPPRKGYAHAVGAFSDDDPYVWLPDGREAAGAGLARDDVVLVYESQSGKTEVRRLPEKAYVAEDPAVALGEQGLRTQSVEYQFPTGDRADVVLTDAQCRVVAVEVEPAVGNSDIVGPLQAIKYRYMLEWVASRARGDSRAFLVAHSIDANMKKLCSLYAIECFEIDRARVDEWRRSRP